MIARLGLFLAVVAWVVGQQHQGFGFAYPIVTAIDKTGVAIAFTTECGHWGIREVRHMPIVLDFLDGVNFPKDVSYWSLHAIAFLYDPGQVSFAIRHWLVVTIFALFYGVLKWVYRKRGKELAADE